MMQRNKIDHTQLICDFGELGGLFTDATSLDHFLQKIVLMVSNHMHSDVCSIYLFYEDTQELVLKATTGLNKDCIGKIRLKLGEGLTGWALKELRPICERNASKNSNFRYFPGLGEELYESFLAVPIIRGLNRIGTMVIQNTKVNYFSDEDIRILQAMTSQLATIIETTRLLISVDEKHDLKKNVETVSEIKFLKGKVGSEGFAYAPMFILDDHRSLEKQTQMLSLNHSLDDFHRAVKETEKQLEEFQQKIEETLADVASLIFTAQILMLKDNSFIEAIVNLIRQDTPPAMAIQTVVNEYVRKFESLPNPYLREKGHDVRDIGIRLLENLVGTTEKNLNLEKTIVIARTLFPSDILKLVSQEVKGIVLLSGGVTSHLSILAQSLQIPLIIIQEEKLLALPSNTYLLIDALAGNLYVNPSHEIISKFNEREETAALLLKQKDSIKETTSTQDGTRIKLLANINLLSDIKNALEFKAEGIGLYRTEFPFIVRADFPSEEEQFVVYRKLVESWPKGQVTFRTLDIGGDKVLSYVNDQGSESNPFLGMRSIRFSLRHIDVFVQQIRAILRAGVGKDIRIMFPMISSLDEFRESKRIVKEAAAALQKEERPCHETPLLGVMIELPSIVEIIDDIAKEADFLSIGTNDLIQYILGVDRTNERVADLYLPHHPAVLRALNKIAEAGKRYGKEVSICGDMACDIKYLPYILGLGIHCLSVNPRHILKLQKAIQELNLSQAQSMSKQLLSKTTIKEINHILGI